MICSNLEDFERCRNQVGLMDASNGQSKAPIFGSQFVPLASETPYSDALKFMGAKKEAFVCHNGHVKRPMNAFMVWSQMERQIIQNKILKSSPGSPRVIHNSEISCQLGKIWARLSEEKRRPYVEEAERMRILHLREFPSYKYRPRKRSRQDEVEADEELGQIKTKHKQGTTLQAKDVKRNERVRQNCLQITPTKTHDFETRSFREIVKDEKLLKENYDNSKSPGTPQTGKKRGRKVFSAVLSSTGALSKLKVFEIIRQNCSTLERCRNMKSETQESNDEDDFPLKRLTLKIRINDKQETKTTEIVTTPTNCNQGMIESPTLPDDGKFRFSPSKPVGTESFLYSGNYQDDLTPIEETPTKNNSFDQYSNDDSFEPILLDDESFSCNEDQIFQTETNQTEAMLLDTEQSSGFNLYDQICDTSNDIRKPFKTYLSEDLEAIEFPAWWKSELSGIDIGRLMQDIQDFDDFPTYSQEVVTFPPSDSSPFCCSPFDGFQSCDLLQGY